MEKTPAEIDVKAPAAEIVAAAEVDTQNDADKIVSKTLLELVHSDVAVPASVLSDLSQVLRRRAKFMLDTTLVEMEKCRVLREMSRRIWEQSNGGGRVRADELNEESDRA